MSDLFRLEAVDDLDAIIVPTRVPRVLRIPHHRTVEGTVLCDHLFKLPTHYIGGRTRICSGKSACEVHKKAPLRIYYLCAIYDRDERETFWYQLPAAAGKALLFGIKTLGRPMLGAAVKVGRKWKDKNAPVILTIDRYTVVAPEQYKPLMPEESVRRCFFSDAEEPSTNRRKAV